MVGGWKTYPLENLETAGFATRKKEKNSDLWNEKEHMGWEPIDQPPYKGDTLRFQYLSEGEEEVSTHSNSQTGFSLKINSTSG